MVNDVSMVLYSRPWVLIKALHFIAPHLPGDHRILHELYIEEHPSQHSMELAPLVESMLWLAFTPKNYRTQAPIMLNKDLTIKESNDTPKIPPKEVDLVYYKCTLLTAIFRGNGFNKDLRKFLHQNFKCFSPQRMKNNLGQFYFT